MPNGATDGLQPRRASQTGHTGRRRRGGWHARHLGNASLTSSSSVVTSPPPRMYVRPAACATVAAQPEARDEIVDVREVIEDLARPEHDEPPRRDLPEDLEQPPIARP